MVMPELPFTLFDFKNIRHWGTRRKLAEAAAGAAIDEILYKVPVGEMALILSADVFTQKTTGTAFSLKIIRKSGTSTPEEFLISETSADNIDFAWPSSKAPSNYKTLGYHLVFMFEGDQLVLTHALTALEAIADDVHWQVIEYTDPRYEK